MVGIFIWLLGKAYRPNSGIIILKKEEDTRWIMSWSCLRGFLHVCQFKWRLLSQPAKIGSGKNKKSSFFLLGLKITLRTCFEYNNFLSNSCPELSNQVLSSSEGQIYYIVGYKNGPANSIKFLTSGGQVWTWWMIFRFREINKSWFWFMARKDFFNFF